MSLKAEATPSLPLHSVIEATTKAHPVSGGVGTVATLDRAVSNFWTTCENRNIGGANFGKICHNYMPSTILGNMRNIDFYVLEDREFLAALKSDKC